MFLVYRGVEDVEARIGAAMKAYYADRGQMPRSMIAPKVELDEARAAAARLGLAGVKVVGCGGCLIPEVWLDSLPMGTGEQR